MAWVYKTRTGHGYGYGYGYGYGFANPWASKWAKNHPKRLSIEWVMIITMNWECFDYNSLNSWPFWLIFDYFWQVNPHGSWARVQHEIPADLPHAIAYMKHCHHSNQLLNKAFWIQDHLLFHLCLCRPTASLLSLKNPNNLWDLTFCNSIYV